MDIYKIIEKPLVTEKGTDMLADGNWVMFRVHPAANKIEIRRAVEALFKTKVLNVRTMNMIGKSRRMGKHVGRKPHWKKAIVQLAPGESIEFFEGT